ncbi:MAG TPA: bifunctional serine/threonine-protein kinase/formylglycine-generating enzyme family protein [Planctomycetota bacterium]|nr:bifunctional serine/threonine-protein kinase/formylglycine-generating enzyme family protein [Planctomycetota bacterium]
MSAQQACPTLGELNAFGRGEAKAEQREIIEQHVQQCTTCADLLRISQSADINDIERTNPRLGGFARPSQTNVMEAPSLPPEVMPVAASPEAQLKLLLSLLQPPAAPDELGRVAGYRLLKHIGSGGMGTVFLAEDLVLRRPTALKVMRPETQTDEGWARLLREARSMAAIKHEHLATVYQAGRQGEVFYLAMELLEGKPLNEWRRTRTPEVPEILRIAREMAEGLQAIHANNLIHRDIKPSNVWIEAPKDKVKILDFGLARPMIINGSTFVTQPGAIAGTPGYMSPEQARGVTLDARSDLFSYGCVLFSLCTGDMPFTGDTLIAQLTSLAVDTPRNVSSIDAKIPQTLSDLIADLLEKEPDRRPASATVVLERLNDIANGKAKPAPQRVLKAPAAPASSNRALPVFAAVSVVLTLAAWLIFTQTRQKPESSTLAGTKPAPEATPEIKKVEPPPPPPKPELPKELALDLGGTKMEFVLVPAGEFTMGSFGKGRGDEEPPHKVRISRSYYIAKYETTVAQWRAFATATKFRTFAEQQGVARPVIDGKYALVKGICWSNPGFPQDDNHPVTQVDWPDAHDFCRWGSTKTESLPKELPEDNWIMRLPTEAEWEFAARGPKNSYYPWGDFWDDVRANLADESLRKAGYPMNWGSVKENDGFVCTAPVGQFKNGVSWVGAYDMCGNVWEWVEDRYDKHYYRNSPAVDPPGPDKGDARVMRGGCWDGDANGAVSMRRGFQGPLYASGNIGFRVVLTRHVLP